MQKTSKTARVQMKKRLRRRNAVIKGCGVLCVVAMVVAVLIFKPSFLGFPGQEKSSLPLVSKAQAKVPPVPPHLDVAPERFYKARGFILVHHKDPETGVVRSEKVTIEELINRRNNYLTNNRQDEMRRVDERLLQEGDNAVEDLYIVMLLGERLLTRSVAASLLGKIGTDKAVTHLWKFIKDSEDKKKKSRFVINEAIRAIANSRNSGAMHYLIQLAESKADESSRLAAIRQLGRFDSKKDLASKTVVRVGMIDPSVDIQKTAIDALGRLATTEGIAAIKKHAVTTDSAEIAERAIKVLGGVRDKGAVEALEEIAKQSKEEDRRKLAKEMAESLRKVLGSEQQK